MLNQNKKKHGFEYTQKFYVMEQNQSIFGFNKKCIQKSGGRFMEQTYG